MWIRPVVALMCLLLWGCMRSPPYVNPLTEERLEALRISEIRIEHLRDGSIDAEKAAKAAALVRTRLIERLGAKFAPGKGDAVLVVPLQLLFGEGGIKSMVTLRIRGKIVGPGLSAEYPGATIGMQAMFGRKVNTTPEGLLATLVNIATADLPALKKPG